MPIDFEADAHVVQNDDDLRQISSLMDWARDKRQEILHIEESLKQAKSELRSIETKQIPDLMMSNNISEFKAILLKLFPHTNACFEEDINIYIKQHPNKYYKPIINPIIKMETPTPIFTGSAINIKLACGIILPKMARHTSSPMKSANCSGPMGCAIPNFMTVSISSIPATPSKWA